MLAVGAGHVLGHGDEPLGVGARMRGDALAFVEDLDHGSGGAHLQQMTDPAVGDAVSVIPSSIQMNSIR